MGLFGKKQQQVVLQIQGGGGGGYGPTIMWVVIGGSLVAFWWYDPFHLFGDKDTGDLDPQHLTKKDCELVNKELTQRSEWYQQVAYGFQHFGDLLGGKADMDELAKECDCLANYSMSCEDKEAADAAEKARVTKCQTAMKTVPDRFQAELGEDYASWEKAMETAKTWWAINGATLGDCPEVKKAVFGTATQALANFEAAMKKARTARTAANAGFGRKVKAVEAQIDAGKVTRKDITDDTVGLRLLAGYIDPVKAGAADINDKRFMAEYNKAKPDWRAAQTILLNYFDAWAARCDLTPADKAKLEAAYRADKAPKLNNQERVEWVTKFMTANSWDACKKSRTSWWVRNLVETYHKDVEVAREKKMTKKATEETRASNLSNAHLIIRKLHGIPASKLSDEAIDAVAAKSYGSVTPLGAKNKMGIPVYMWQGWPCTKAADLWGKLEGGFEAQMAGLSQRGSYAYWLEWYGRWDQLSGAEKAKSTPPALNNFTNDSDVVLYSDNTSGKWFVGTKGSQAFNEAVGKTDNLQLYIPIGSVWWQPWDMQKVHKIKNSAKKFIPKKPVLECAVGEVKINGKCTAIET